MIRVLVVDDDVLTAEAHAAYVGRLDGFLVAGVAHTGGEALRLVADADARLGGARFRVVLPAEAEARDDGVRA